MAMKEKALKKSKLRHAEYYDFQEMQDKLYAESKNDKIFNKLVEVIIQPENIRLAYRNMKKNDGSHTPGTDGKTIADLEKISDEEIVTLVQRKLTWYVPQSVRRVEIRKDNGKIRPLGIPTILDRLIQQCVLQVLEPICEAKFHEHSYGFRPNRSQQNAIAQVHKNMQLSHLHYVVDIDIKGFFDNIDHNTLIAILRKRIKDEKFLRLIRKFLSAGYMEDNTFHETYSGAVQGGIISPILANIYLDQFDKYMKEYKAGFEKGRKRAVLKSYARTGDKRHRLVEKISKSQNQEARQTLIAEIKGV